MKNRFYLLFILFVFLNANPLDISFLKTGTQIEDHMNSGLYYNKISSENDLRNQVLYTYWKNNDKSDEAFEDLNFIYTKFNLIEKKGSKNQIKVGDKIFVFGSFIHTNDNKIKVNETVRVYYKFNTVYSIQTDDSFVLNLQSDQIVVHNPKLDFQINDIEDGKSFLEVNNSLIPKDNLFISTPGLFDGIGSMKRIPPWVLLALTTISLVNGNSIAKKYDETTSSVWADTYRKQYEKSKTTSTILSIGTVISFPIFYIDWSKD